jgi:hypothetical protein
MMMVFYCCKPKYQQTYSRNVEEYMLTLPSFVFRVMSVNQERRNVQQVEIIRKQKIYLRCGSEDSRIYVNHT